MCKRTIIKMPMFLLTIWILQMIGLEGKTVSSLRAESPKVRLKEELPEQFLLGIRGHPKDSQRHQQNLSVAKYDLLQSNKRLREEVNTSELNIGKKKMTSVIYDNSPILQNATNITLSIFHLDVEPKRLSETLHFAARASNDRETKLFREEINKRFKVNLRDAQLSDKEIHSTRNNSRWQNKDLAKKVLHAEKQTEVGCKDDTISKMCKKISTAPFSTSNINLEDQTNKKHITKEHNMTSLERSSGPHSRAKNGQDKTLESKKKLNKSLHHQNLHSTKGLNTSSDASYRNRGDSSDKLDLEVHKVKNFSLGRVSSDKNGSLIEKRVSSNRGTNNEVVINLHSSILRPKEQNDKLVSVGRPLDAIDQMNVELLVKDNNNLGNGDEYEKGIFFSRRINSESHESNHTRDFKSPTNVISEQEKLSPVSNNKTQRHRADRRVLINRADVNLGTRSLVTSLEKSFQGKNDRQLWNIKQMNRYNNVLNPSDVPEFDMKIKLDFDENHSIPSIIPKTIREKTSGDLKIVKPAPTHFQSPTTTTLPSVFEENLIPPLPQNWQPSRMEHLWDRADSIKYERENSEEGDEEKAERKELENRFSSSEEDIISDEANSSLSGNQKSSLLSYVNKPNKNSQPNRQFKMEKTNYLDVTDSKDVTKHKSSNKSEAIPTVKISGKADTNDDAATAYGREKISFITIPPGSYWHLWGGFSSRRRIDPFFQFNTNSNMTRGITQVYTAYWGTSSGGKYEIVGIWILRFGSGAALVTLIITVIAQTMKFCQPLFSQKAVLTTNLATSLAAAHVVLLFGIKATDGVWICGVVSLFLHFLYLLTCNWILALSIRLLASLLHKKPFPTAAFCIPVWIASLAVVVVSYGMNPSGYETRNFCWLSVERGMLIAFIAPVCTLLIVNAAICIACQKLILDAGPKSDPNDRNDLRAGVSLLPLHGVAWFLAVVALEDQLSLALDCVSAIATAAVGYFILHFYVPSWQLFLYEWLPCSTHSEAKNKSLVPQTSHDIAQLPLLETQQQPSTSNNNFTSTATSNTILLEEYQMQSLYLNSGRRAVY